MGNQRIYKAAKPDNFSKGITITIFFLLIFFIFGMAIMENYFWAGLGGAITLIIVIIISLTLKPSEFIQSANQLLIKKQFGHTARIENILSADKASGNGLRTFGVGGVFAYTGWYNGNEEWFVTDRKKAVILKSDKKTVVISPENPDEFIKNLKNFIPNE